MGHNTSGYYGISAPTFGLRRALCCEAAKSGFIPAASLRGIIKLKIISDGTSGKTRVVNEYTGEMVKGVYEVSWRCEISSFAEATIKVRNVPVEVSGTLDSLLKGRRRIEI